MNKKIERGRLVGPQTYTRIPTVVVDDLHVIYKIKGRMGHAANPAAALKRIVTGERKRGREVHAIKGISFAAYEGDAIGVIGSNGSGKSTLLRTIAGLLRPAQGAVYTRSKPSLLGVNAVLLNDLPGEWNVMLGLLAMGMKRSEAKRYVAKIVDFSGINEKGDFSSLPMRTYSSGMSARLRFSIAAAKEHDVLLIDEALATGDAAFRERSSQRVQELRSAAGTVFIVSHDSNSVRDYCERAIWLEAGVIRMDGPTDEVVDAYEEFTRAKMASTSPPAAPPPAAAPAKAAEPAAPVAEPPPAPAPRERSGSATMAARPEPAEPDPNLFTPAEPSPAPSPLGMPAPPLFGVPAVPPSSDLPAGAEPAASPPASAPMATPLAAQWPQVPVPAPQSPVPSETPGYVPPDPGPAAARYGSAWPEAQPAGYGYLWPEGSASGAGDPSAPSSAAASAHTSQVPPRDPADDRARTDPPRSGRHRAD